MGALQYIYGSEARVQQVVRSALQRLFEGTASAVLVLLVLTAEGSLSVQWAAGVTGLVAIVPAVLRVAAEGIPQTASEPE